MNCLHLCWVLSIFWLPSTLAQAPALDENIITAHLMVTLRITSIDNSTFDINDPEMYKATSESYKNSSMTICNRLKNILTSDTTKTTLKGVVYQNCVIVKLVNIDWKTYLRLEFSSGAVNLTDARNLLSASALLKQSLTVSSVFIRDIDECTEMKVCSAYSSCNNSEGGFTCTCNEGYVDVANSYQNLIGGRYCSEPCLNHSCSGHGTCRVRFDGPIVCECDSDYNSTNCKQYVGPPTAQTPAGVLKPWSIVVIAISMGVLAIFLMIVIPLIVYQTRKYQLLKEESEHPNTYGSFGSGPRRSSIGTISSTSITAYQAMMARPSEQGEFTIPRPIVINARDCTLHRQNGSNT